MNLAIIEPKFDTSEYMEEAVTVLLKTNTNF
jgi:hypothetical protein